MSGTSRARVFGASGLQRPGRRVGRVAELGGHREHVLAGRWLTRSGLVNARETVDAATPAAAATSVIVARRRRVGPDASHAARPSMAKNGKRLPCDADHSDTRRRATRRAGWRPEDRP